MQYVANAMVQAGWIFLVGLGFHWVLRTSGYLNFSHGLFVALGGYGLLLWSRVPGMSVWLAVIPVIVSVAIIAFCLNEILHRPLRRRGATNLVHLLASIGVYEAGSSVLALAFTDRTRSLGVWAAEPGWFILGARVTPAQVLVILVALGTAGTVWLINRRSRLGLRWSAVSLDSFLASARGIDTGKVHREVFVWSAVTAAIAGALIGSDAALNPQMGLSPMMLAATAVIIGEPTLRGFFISSLLVAGLRQLSVIWLPSQWQDAITFLLLMAVLLARPGRLVTTLMPKVRA
jgi:branched-chain amino acid transport system permease protein